MSRVARTLLVLLLLGATFAAGFAARSALERQQPPAADTRPRPVTGRQSLGSGEQATIALFQRASPSVVFITSLAVRRELFSLNVLEIPRGAGSGVVWDRDGHVLTNFHVIENADAAQVTLADHSTWDARLIGRAPEKDLAVLVIDAPPDRLHPIPVGSSHDLQVGQNVLAIGNPFGLDQTLTTGIISALGREIQGVGGVPIRDVIQTDAAINPGNSGGPLLDSAGRLIGINTAIYSPSGAYAGVGFAIPVDTVNWVVPELIRSGRLKRPSLGVELAPDPLTRQLGIDGALVVDVVPNGPAAKSGLQPTRRDRFGRVRLGDRIVAFDGEPVHSAGDLQLLLEKHAAGDRVSLTVVGDHRQRELSLTLGPPS